VKTVRKRPKIYGLTGGIASGKSTAANFFIKNQIEVFDCDLMVKKMWEFDDKLKLFVFQKFNINIDENDDKLKIKKMIFEDENVRKKIEKFIHPQIFKLIDAWILKNQDEKFLIIDMPLLFETKYSEKVDKIILIYASLKNQIKRLMIRNLLTKTDAINRIKLQMPMDIKVLNSHYVIDNNGKFAELQIKLEKLLKELLDENH